jgi:hypothetical protein
VVGIVLLLAGIALLLTGKPKGAISQAAGTRSRLLHSRSHSLSDDRTESEL